MVGLAGAVFADATTGNHGAPANTVSDAKFAKTLAVVDGDNSSTGMSPTGPADDGGRTAASPLAPPSNDDCSGALVIPDGPYPLSTTPENISEATPQGADEGILIYPIDNTVWYSFTPSQTGFYTFSTCAGAGAGGSTVYDTVIGLFASTGGSCPPVSPALNANDTGAGCPAAVPGSPPYVDQSTMSAVLTGGQTYLVVVGHYSDGGSVDAPWQDVTLLVTLAFPPANDTCSAPTPLALNRVTNGTTAGAQNDYRSDSSAACFSGVGQTGTTAAGIDSVFSFTAPADGSYSVRYVQDDSAASLRGQNPVLYASDSCPAPAPAGPVVPCLKGANRITDQVSGNQNRSEELDCMPLTAGQTIYVYFDDRNAGNAGGPLGLEVTECHRESEPNDTTAQANIPGCFETGTINPGDSYACVGGTNPGVACTPSVSVCTGGGVCAFQSFGDADFYSLGQPPAGSWVFAAVDAVAANNGDFEMRITNETDTLQYDNDDGTSQVSANAPVIGGAPADGNPLYARISFRGGIASEPYHLYTRVETGAPQLEAAEPPSNFSFYYANPITNGGFVRGSNSSASDGDCFKFIANEGDNIAMFTNNNPDRLSGGINNTWPILYDLLGGPPTATRFTGQVTRNNLTASPGTLTGTTPSVVSQFWDYRARYTGVYMVCYYPDSGAPSNPSGAFPLPYAGSISLNCGAIPSATDYVGDVSITKTGPAGPVNTSDIVEYTITVTNNSDQPAAYVQITDSLPAELGYLGLFVDDGFGGGNLDCISLPSDGTNDAPIDCTNYSMAPHTTTTYTLFAQVQNCIGAGLDVTNSATIVTGSTDSTPDNNSSSWSFTTEQTGVCTDFNACTEGDHCEGTTCVASDVNCDDGSICTDDSCNVNTGCLNDPTPGNQCDDGNPCTGDACDPIDGCVFPPAAAGVACDDFFTCTTGDQCDGFGGCAGVSACNDGNGCTDDFADEGNACACSYAPTAPGTECSDGNACTTGDLCDGANLCVGGDAPNCDDNNPCTDDSCDAQLGCVNTPNNASCDDGDACTSGDACGGGSCQPGTGVVCNDGNGCTDDSCNPASGCVYTNNTAACDDGNACTANDVCGGGSCGGTAVVCNDGNVCTDDSCNPASGCVYANNTNSCDDGNPNTSNDTCNAGVCAGTSSCTPTGDPKTWGWYHSLCTSGGHSGDSITDADAVCVAADPTFAGFTSASQVCDVLDPSHGNNDAAAKAMKQEITLLLNICKQRVCPVQATSSICGSANSVGQTVTQVDAVLANPNSTIQQIGVAECQATEVNNGRALDLDTLKLGNESGNTRLNWVAPTLNNPKNYTIWRRISGSGAAFVKIGTAFSATFLDTNTGTASWDYLVKVNY